MPDHDCEYNHNKFDPDIISKSNGDEIIFKNSTGAAVTIYFKNPHFVKLRGCHVDHLDVLGNEKQTVTIDVACTGTCECEFNDTGSCSSVPAPTGKIIVSGY